MGAPACTNIYVKGDFQNIIFCEFGNTEDRDTTTARVRSSNLKRDGHTVWCTPDRPPLVRAVRNLCFGFKYFLKISMNMEWAIRVTDQSPCTVDVGGERALTVTIDGNTIRSGAKTGTLGKICTTTRSSRNCWSHAME